MQISKGFARFARRHAFKGTTVAATAAAVITGVAATPSVTLPRSVYIRNLSTCVSDAEVRNALPAFQAAQTKDFRPYWDVNAHLVFIGKAAAPSGQWSVTLLNTSDIQGALAYHETTRGVPDSKVFVCTSKDGGYAWTVGFTHELWEMEADPGIDRAAQDSQGLVWAFENADPVERDSQGYTRPGADGRPVQLSDFVTEAWFGAGTTRAPYDFMDRLTAPLSVMDGGYAQFWNGMYWQQVLGPCGPCALRHSKIKQRFFYDLPHVKAP